MMNPFEEERQRLAWECERWAKVEEEAARERKLAVKKAIKGGMTQREAADAAGLSLGTVNAIVNGPRVIPNGDLRAQFDRWDS
jgi:DNA-binding XRE family transcriptional regulator